MSRHYLRNQTIIKMSFVGTFSAPDRTGCHRTRVALVPGTGRYEYQWSRGGISHPYWITCGKKRMREALAIGEPYLWLRRSVDQGGYITISQFVLTDVLSRGLKYFETNVYPIGTLFVKGNKSSTRHRLYLPKIAFDLTRRVIDAPYDPQFRIDLAEMEVIS